MVDSSQMVSDNELNYAEDMDESESLVVEEASHYSNFLRNRCENHERKSGFKNEGWDQSFLRMT